MKIYTSFIFVFFLGWIQNNNCLQYIPNIVMQAQDIFEKIPVVCLTEKGKFKYILIQGQQKDNSDTKYLFVRGDQKYGYHSQNYEAFQEQLQVQGFKVKKGNYQRVFSAQKQNKVFNFTCRGGGRIQHNYKGKKCFIYGYSQSFGKVDHSVAQQLIAKQFHYELQEIQTSQQGY